MCAKKRGQEDERGIGGQDEEEPGDSRVIMDPRRSRQRGQRSWGGFFHYYVCERFDQTHQRRRRRGRGLDRWLAT